MHHTKLLQPKAMSLKEAGCVHGCFCVKLYVESFSEIFGVGEFVGKLQKPGSGGKSESDDMSSTCVYLVF